MTIGDLAKLIIALTGSSARLIFQPRPEDDPARRRPDITLAQRELGWAPTVGIREGMQQTINDFRERLKKAGRI